MMIPTTFKRSFITYPVQPPGLDELTETYWKRITRLIRMLGKLVFALILGAVQLPLLIAVFAVHMLTLIAATTAKLADVVVNGLCPTSWKADLALSE